MVQGPCPQEVPHAIAHELRNEIKRSKQVVRKMRKYRWSVKREKGSEKGEAQRREWIQKEEQAERIQKEQRNRVLCDSHESKAKELGKCGGKAMNCDRKRWSTGGTSVTSQALMPAQAPMRTLCSGLDIWGLDVFFLL